MEKEYAPFVRKVEVEVETLGQVREAADAGADIIMLDNMDIDTMKKAIEIIDGRAQTECSGNVTKENIDTLIMGLPKNMNNTLGTRAEVTLHFKKMIESYFQSFFVLYFLFVAVYLLQPAEIIKPSCYCLIFRYF